MITNEDQTSKNNNPIPFILFILNIIVIANTNKDNFSIIGREDYYNFNLAMLVVSLILFVVQVVAGCGVLVNSEDNKALTFIIYLVALIFLAIFLSLMYLMGVLWNKDPEHTILFYQEYWNEGVMNFDNIYFNSTLDGKVQVTPFKVDKLWAYTMSDVINRIYSTIFILLYIVLGLVACCGGGAMLFKKLGETSTHKSSSVGVTI